MFTFLQRFYFIFCSADTETRTNIFAIHVYDLLTRRFACKDEVIIEMKKNMKTTLLLDNYPKNIKYTIKLCVS